MSASQRLRRLGALVGASALLVSLAACSSATEDSASATITEGKLTIATGEPAYYPYVIDDAPDSGEGFEAAVAYAIAEELGYDAADVVWVRTTFEAAIQPGPKDFDFNLQQYTITEERAQNVDFSTPVLLHTSSGHHRGVLTCCKRHQHCGPSGSVDWCRQWNDLVRSH
jgi:polar amino acid transport system substrate-binding protein